MASRPLRAVFALVFSGVVQAWISPPSSLLWLHPIAWVPAFVVFSRLEGRRALFAGWLVGASANIAIFSWLAATVTRYGNLPFPLALAVLLLYAATTGFYVAVFAWGFARIRRHTGARWPFAIATWFCAVEFFNPQLFGYLQGVAWYQVPEIFLVSAFTGVSGMSFLVILCNALVVQATELVGNSERHRPRLRRLWVVNVAIAAGLLLLSAGYSANRLQTIERTEAAAAVFRVALVQPNHTIERRRELAQAGRESFAADLVGQSRRAVAQSHRKIDVFVWPEGALRADPLQPFNREALSWVRESESEVWTGANHHGVGPGAEPVAHNSAFRIYGDGSVDRRYDKNILVPFGEYVPLENVIPGFDRIPTVGRFEPGTDVPTYATRFAKFVFLICYEAIRPAFVRDAVANGADLIVNVTVDAWYGDSAEQSQHLMLAAIQSALHGVPLLRATTTGISAFVDARGVITAKTGTFRRETLIGDVRPLRVPGLYARSGDWFAWLCVLVSIGVLLRPRVWYE